MHREGRVQIVTGPMFAGKSEELLRRVRRAELAELAVEVVNHSLDDRHGTHEVTSHLGRATPSTAAPDVASIGALLDDRHVDLLAIDEAQFFGTDLVPAVDEFASSGMTVVVAGLCVTFDGRPFEPLPSLMALAEDVVKLTAVCAVCGDDAVFHQRVRAGDGGDARAANAQFIGGIETYQARCRRHFAPEA